MNHINVNGIKNVTTIQHYLNIIPMNQTLALHHVAMNVIRRDGLTGNSFIGPSN